MGQTRIRGARTHAVAARALQYTARTHWPAGFSGRVLSREMRCGGSPGGWNAAALAASGPLMIAASSCSRLGAAQEFVVS